MSRWIWHGWQSPEVKKLQDWWINPLPPNWASGVSSNIFHLNCLQPERWNWLYSLLASRLAQSAQAPWAVLGMTTASRAVSVLDLPYFFLSYLFSPAPSSFFSLSPLFPCAFIFLFFLIFLYLCSGIVIQHQCYSGVKNMLFFFTESCLVTWGPRRLWV